VSKKKGENMMRLLKGCIKNLTLRKGFQYLEKNPTVNFPKLIDWAEKLVAQKEHVKAIQIFRNIMADPQNNWNILIQRFFSELNLKTKQKMLSNFIVNSGIISAEVTNRLMKKYQCNIPWAILMDPTSACNLKCKGCWAAEYDKSASLSFATLDRIIREGKKLGIYMYIYAGGEPLIRKNDLIQLAQKHKDCMFLAFTNATLVDDAFAAQLAQVGNFLLAISVEGFESETDFRRGDGTYQKILAAMQLLKKHGIAFGFSTCYHSKNCNIVGSEKYIDFMIDKGCMFGWYFTYMPLGKDAVPDLMVSAEQRAYMYHQVREFRTTKPIFLMDFWNDGEYVNGCIAGGRRYFHINASGDVEPCGFIHYSNVNIKQVSVLEALKSPIFEQYRKNQAFNQNHLRPCPLLDNPEKLKMMVHAAQANSTQPIDEESVDALTDKCQCAAAQWAPVADDLWSKTHN
jgi:MoaA/NifB/PqqE/SkfB family radical SAM enzyme